ncbi:Hypothetical predicted protein, partial [Pelobates cultripes]
QVKWRPCSRPTPTHTRARRQRRPTHQPHRGSTTRRPSIDLLHAPKSPWQKGHMLQRQSQAQNRPRGHGPGQVPRYPMPTMTQR